jgi:hypothetical protein
MTGHLALYRMLLMMEHAEVTEIHWDGSVLRTVPAGRVDHLHIDLRKTILGWGDPPNQRPPAKPFTLTHRKA